MHIPSHFVETDSSYIRTFIQDHAFGTLVTWDGQHPAASHLLMNVQASTSSELILAGHLAKANPQWKAFDSRIEALAIFHGPHCYVSASWYSVQSAPTWNYIVVHAYGKVTIVEDRTELYQLLKNLVDSQEQYSPEHGRYQIESMPKDLLENMMNSIVGFRIHMSRVECAAKLSQNRNDRDQEHIISMLRARGDPDSVSIAEAMADKKRELKANVGSL